MSWKEQAVAIPVEAEGLVLEGIWQSGTGRAAVIAPPHPEYGGSLDNPVVNEIAYALHRENYASIRFNWRGVGASQGRRTGSLAAAEADYDAALVHLHRTVDAPILGAGYSFGAAAAVRVGLRDARIRALLLVAPPFEMIRDLPLEGLGKPLHVIVGDHDRFAPIDLLSELLAPLPHARLEVIPKADHFFSVTGLAELHQAARAAAA
jgi:hypothetical protein